MIISYSSRSYAFLPAQIAVAKGFFKDENLEPLLIQMRSQVTVVDKTYEFAIESRKATVRTDKPIPARAQTLRGKADRFRFRS